MRIWFPYVACGYSSLDGGAFVRAFAAPKLCPLGGWRLWISWSSALSGFPYTMVPALLS